MLSIMLDLILSAQDSLQQRSKWNPFSLKGAETSWEAALQIIIGLKNAVHSTKNTPSRLGTLSLNNVGVL